MSISPLLRKYNIMPNLSFEIVRRSIAVWGANTRRILVLLPVLCVLAGCASTSSSKKIIASDVPLNENVTINPVAPSVVPVKTAVKAPVLDGIIFGKADFRGVLKVEYVKLNIVDEENPEKQYELLFGERDENNAPTWDARPSEPHYFFLELPAGRYRITTISIPVGTTLATESTDISFTVEKETVIYLGTLRVTGTDQKIRFGGVPLLRPGFEYRVEILNEKEEAIRRFKIKYPDIQRDIQVKLMMAMRIQAF